MANGGERERLPREVWIATLTQEGIEGTSCQEITEKALRKMEGFLPQRPDIFCLPETFHYFAFPGARPAVQELVDTGEAPIIEAMATFARRNRCYVIAPILTGEAGACYNAAVLIDRTGTRMGEYRKVRTTEDEMDCGVSPGPVGPTVFDTDFGRIGIQICYDIEWPQGWKALHDQGAEIVFWASAFGGGKRIGGLAWMNRYCVVSSTAKGASRICDMTGETIAESGLWDPNGVCAGLNLEKAFIHTWPYVEKFGAVRGKYGRSIRIYSLHEEEFSVIESRSADVRVADVMREFGIPSYDEHLRRAEKRHRVKDLAEA